MSDTPKNYCNCLQCQTVDCPAGRELADLERELDEAENNLLRAIGLYDSCKDDAARSR
jgi:hypothetical protein